MRRFTPRCTLKAARHAVRLVPATMAVAVVLLCVLGTVPRSLTAQTDRSAGVRGRILDSDGIAVSQASVLLQPEERRARTDSLGEFLFLSLKQGRYEIRVRRVGFAPLDTAVELLTGRRTVLDVQLQRVSQNLPRVVVRGRDGNCERRTFDGFLCRRADQMGSSMDPGEIAEKQAFFLAELFWDVPGFRIVPTRGGLTLVSTRDWRCTRTLVNGRPPDARMNPLPTVEMLMGVEWFDAEHVPAEYDEYSWSPASRSTRVRGSTKLARCGLIVYWTRDAKGG